MPPHRFSPRRVSPRPHARLSRKSPAAYVHRKTVTATDSCLWNRWLYPFLHRPVPPPMPPPQFSPRRVSPRLMPDSLENPPLHTYTANGRQPPPCRLTDF